MADTTNPFGGGATGGTGGMFGGGMWGAPSPYGGGGYGGYGGSYGGYSSPYGGFGGGMPYGGGYGAPSPYGAPGGYGGGYGGYGGGYSPYGMPQGYGGYGMQSPYGGYSPYGMPSQYGPQASYGMPQQQTMMAPEAAPQTMAATTDGAEGDATGDVTPAEDPNFLKNLNIGGSTTQTNRFDPWGPQQEQLRRYLTGMTGEVKDGKLVEVSGEGMPTTGAMGELYKQQQAGALGFDPQSEAALQRMQALSTGANPMVDAATGATQGIASGQANIGTGGMFQSLYANPGIQNAGQYSEMYQRPGITVDPYGDMYGRNAIGNAGQYNQIYGGTQGAGSLAGGAYGQIARGDLMNANPYREKALADAMAQTSDEVKATMSSRGRYGSDAYGDAMGRALGQVATQARMAGYDTDTANMMAAAQARSSEGLARGSLGLQTAQGLSGIQGQNYNAQMSALQGMNAAQQMANQQRMAAAGGLTAVQGQNWQNQLGAANALTGVSAQDIQNRMSAAGMAPQMQQLRYDDIQRQMQAGAAREAMAQQQKNYGWDTLRQFQGLVGGVPGSAGTAKGTEQKPWWETALALGATAAGMWGAPTPPA